MFRVSNTIIIFTTNTAKQQNSKTADRKVRDKRFKLTIFLPLYSSHTSHSFLFTSYNLPSLLLLISPKNNNKKHRHLLFTQLTQYSLTMRCISNLRQKWHQQFLQFLQVQFIGNIKRALNHIVTIQIIK